MLDSICVLESMSGDVGDLIEASFDGVEVRGGDFFLPKLILGRLESEERPLKSSSGLDSSESSSTYSFDFGLR